ncbi:MAG: ester cyclase [Dehalococcoidia bacterium]
MSNKPAARRILEDEISNANFAITEELVHPDFYDHTNPPELAKGIAGHQGIIRVFKAAFPDLKWTVDDILEDGDKVVVRTTANATHNGDFFGVPATGRHVCFSGVHIMRFQDGKLIEHWGSNDDLGLFRQLGVVNV